MPFTIVDYGDQPGCQDCAELPNVYDYNPGAVIECDRCGQRWYVNKFRLWDKTDWGKK